VPEHHIPIVNILGMTEDMTSPGAIVFERDGRTGVWMRSWRRRGPELFVMFSDATSGRETYGAGRFLYVGLPTADRIEVDFNEAYIRRALHRLRDLPAAAAAESARLGVDAGELKYVRAH